MTKVSIIIKELRESLGLSQLKFAKTLGYSSGQYVSNIERGTCSFPIQKIRLIESKYGRAKAKRVAEAIYEDIKAEIAEVLK